MSWYKKADSPYYSYKQREKSRDGGGTSTQPSKDAKKLFEYIKRNKNMTVTFYHGTSDNILRDIMKQGYFTAPTVRNVADRESRSSGLNEVFFTTSVDYASYYAFRSKTQEEERNKDPSIKSVILQLEIPLYWLKEVSDVILGTESLNQIYNEYNMHNKINVIVNSNESIKEKADKIVDFFINRHLQVDSDEFTIKYAVPVRFIKKSTLSDKGFLVEALNKIATNSAGSADSLVPSYFSQDKQVRESLRGLKRRKSPAHTDIWNQDSLFFQITDKKYRDEIYEMLLDELTDPSNDFPSILGSQKITEIRQALKFRLASLGYKRDSKTVKIAFENLYPGYPYYNLLEQLGFLKDAGDYLRYCVLQYISGDYTPLYEDIKEIRNQVNKNHEILIKVGAITNGMIGSLRDVVQQIGRAEYLRKVDMFPLENRQEYYDMSPLSEDPEANNIRKASLRRNYLDHLVNADGNIEIQQEFARTFEQPLDLEHDDKNAQEAFVNGLLAYMKRKVSDEEFNYNNREPNRRQRRSMFKTDYSFYTYPTDKKEKDDIGKMLFPAIKEIPYWILKNKEFRDKIGNFYKHIMRYNIFKYDQRSINDRMLTDWETGKPIDYHKESLQYAIEHINDHRLSEAPSIDDIAEHPDLLEIYKRKILENIHRGAFAVLGYVYFSGKKNPLVHYDEQVFSAAVESLRDNIGQKYEEIFDGLSKFLGSEYKPLEDPFLGENFKTAILNTIVNKILYEKGDTIKILDLLKQNPQLQKEAFDITKEHLLAIIPTETLISLRNIYAMVSSVFSGLLIDNDVYAAVKQRISSIITEGKLLPEMAYHLVYFRFLDEFSNDQELCQTLAQSYVTNLQKIDQNDLADISKTCVQDIPQMNESMLTASVMSLDISKIATKKFYVSAMTKALISLDHYKEEKYGLIHLLANMNLNRLLPETAQEQQVIYLQAQLKQKLLSTIANHQTNSVDASSTEKKFNGWYKRIKIADDYQTIDQINPDKAYETFKNTYDKSTGVSWSKEKFLSRANGWRFYGDNEGYITVREQKSGMLKMTGMAGSMKSIYKGMQELLAESQPVWGMVTKNIADMAVKAGFMQADAQLVRENINKIPAEVFGGAQIKGVGQDGGVEFFYSDVGTSVKYLIGNQSYFSFLSSMSAFA